MAKNIEEILELITSNSDNVSEMQAQSDRYALHYTGRGTDKFLSIINQYENETQHELRTKFAISNQWLTDELLRPIDNIWTAKGGELQVKGVKDSEKKVQEIASNVKPGYTLRQYMKDIWLQRFIIDPNGMIFIEVSDDGTKVYPVFKSIYSIQAYKRNGTGFDWIAFDYHETIIIDEPDKEEEPNSNKKEIKYFWFVDSDAYYLIKNVDDETFTIDDQKKNTFKTVPAVVNSTIYDTELEMMISPIHRQVDMLNSYLTKNSVKEIYQYLHNYPVFWQYQSLCATCVGKKKLPDGTICPTCNGTGLSSKKDVSDVFVLERAKHADDPQIAPPPAGYVQTDIGTMGENRTELDWVFDKLFHSMWGTTTEKQNNETATGRFIDVKPVDNRLNTLADIAQMVETEILKLVVKSFMSIESVAVSYGRRYLIETPDQIWKRYQDARKNKVSNTILDYMLEQFYLTEFANNQKQSDYYTRMMDVEPYVHHSITEVMNMSVDELTKRRKLYFSEWKKTIELNEVLTKRPEDIVKSLDEYISDKVLTINPQENEKGNTTPGEGN